MTILEQIQLRSKDSFTKEKRISVSKILNSVKVPFDQDSIAAKCAEKNHIPGYKYFGMSKDQIIAQWNDKSNKGTSSGVTLDNWIQHILSGTEKPIITDESVLKKCDQFNKFKLDVIDRKNLQVVGTEIWISSNEITAKTDSLFSIREHLILFDWKNTENITVHNSYGKSLIGPMSSFEECESVLYTLQVYLYKYLLETFYGLQVSSARFIQFTEHFYKIHDNAFAYDENHIKEIIKFAKSLN